MKQKVGQHVLKGLGEKNFFRKIEKFWVPREGSYTLENFFLR